jgi:dipeptidyl aminopeptidase/acylaminoacyl peptidase
MRSALRFALSVGLILAVQGGSPSLAQPPGVTPRDCAEMQWIKEISMNTSGTQLAYLVKSPNLARNVNLYQLYVKDISDVTPSNGKLLMTGDEMSHVRWLRSDQRIVLLVSKGGVTKLVSVDLTSGATEVVFPTEEGIDSFSMDATGDTVAYSVPDSVNEKHDKDKISKDEAASGYRVFEKQDTAAAWMTSSIYLRHRDANGKWSAPRAIALENPFTHAMTTHPAHLFWLSVSPNGKKVALDYYTNGSPEEWGTNPYFETLQKQLDKQGLPVIFDVESGKTTLALKAIFTLGFSWSPDSQTLFVNSGSPSGSRWEAEDIRDHLVTKNRSSVNMFSLNIATGGVDEVSRKLISIEEGPMFFFPNGDVMIKASRTSVVRMHRSTDGWKEVDHLTLPGKAEDRFYNVRSNGEEIFGLHETVTTPDDLFRYKPGQRKIGLLTNLNARFKTLRTATVRTTQWTTTEGLHVSGLLFVPPDYVLGRPYPLVIQTKPNNSGWFACDFGPSKEPSFAPQPIASAGIMYLVRTYPENYDGKEEVDTLPRGYPGGISEAVQQMDIWDSAVDTLYQRGLIDKSKVGIIGFSRTGWHVEFGLVHARTRFAAATATDNVQYSLSEYWIPSLARGVEQMYGGPPYGKTLENWEKYSISYNLDKVHTPLLLEEMGYGVHDDRQLAPPTMLAERYEITTGLRQLNKPVEMYYYPDDVHQVDHPRALQTTMQRNVDWYRFWLQGYERPDPEDPDQRWEHLRELRDADVGSTAKTVESSQPH